jgi:hypothetical protein
MAATAQLAWGRIFRQAVVGGLGGSLLFQLYLWLTVVLPQQGSMPAYWQTTAAAVVVGKIALTRPGYAWLGFLIYLLVGIGWAGAYAYLAAGRRIFNQHWAISGLVYGLVVYVVMSLMLFAGNALTGPPNPNAFINAVIAHSCFFGLPIAYVVRAMQAR